MKRSSKIAVTAITVTLLVSGAALAGRAGCFGPGGIQQHWFDGPTPEERAGWMTERISKKLELDPAQRAKLEELKTTLLSIRSDVGEERQKARESMLALLDAPALDRQKVLQMVDAKMQKVHDKAPEVVDAIAGFTDSLNPSQKQFLRQRIESRSAQ